MKDVERADWGWSVESRPLGPYEATVGSWPAGAGTSSGPLLDESAHNQRTIRREDIHGLIRHLLQALEKLEDRAREDLTAGDCEKCGNTRMVVVQVLNRDVLENCPRCTPKIAAERLRVRAP